MVKILSKCKLVHLLLASYKQLLLLQRIFFGNTAEPN